MAVPLVRSMSGTYVVALGGMVTVVPFATVSVTATVPAVPAPGNPG